MYINTLSILSDLSPSLMWSNFSIVSCVKFYSSLKNSQMLWMSEQENKQGKGYTQGILD